MVLCASYCDASHMVPFRLSSFCSVLFVFAYFCLKKLFTGIKSWEEKNFITLTKYIIKIHTITLYNYDNNYIICTNAKVISRTSVVHKLISKFSLSILRHLNRQQEI